MPRKIKSRPLVIAFAMIFAPIDVIPHSIFVLKLHWETKLLIFNDFNVFLMINDSQRIEIPSSPIELFHPFN